MNTMAFNLEKAISGHKMTTRNGFTVTEFTYFKTATNNTPYCCFAVVENTVMIFSTEGKHKYDPGYDLFLVPITHTRYINIYKSVVGDNVFISSHLYETKKAAIAEINCDKLYIKTIPVTWEESHQ